jgi:regulator of RNase E activity RraA
MADELVERFRTIPPATIGHLLAEGFMDTALRPIFGPVSVAGRAVTVQMPRGDSALTRPAIRALQPGNVLVIAQGGDTQVANWGEMTSLGAKMRGAAGVILDGSVTDVVEIRQQGMPTFARAISARVGRRLGLPGGAVNEPVECGGILVRPGDLVLADDNGIVVMSPQVAEEIYSAARKAEDRSPLVRQWLQNGGDLAEASGKDPAELEAMLCQRNCVS